MLTVLTPLARKRAMSLGLAALVTITLAGCAAPSYRPAGMVKQENRSSSDEPYGMGYSETELADDRYAVCFDGRGNKDQVLDLSDTINDPDQEPGVVITAALLSFLVNGTHAGVVSHHVTDYENMARLRAAEVTLARGYTHFVIESDKASNITVNSDGQLCNDDSLKGCDKDHAEDVSLVTLQIRLLKSPDSSVQGVLDAKSTYNSLASKYKKSLPGDPSWRLVDSGYRCGSI